MEAEQFSDLRTRWREELVGGEYCLEDTEIEALIVKNDISAQKSWETINKEISKSFLWADAAGIVSSADLTTNYRRLESMAKAFSMRGSSLYGNKELLKDIIDGLEWMDENRYHEYMAEYDNWWNWEIGVPQSLNNTVVLLYEHLTKRQIENYMNAVYYFQPDPSKSGIRDRFPDRVNRETTGANRVDTAIVAAIRGAIIEDEHQISAARDALSAVFLYVEQGDGFYTDGSFVQHGNVPYTGTYGEVLLSGMATLLNLLSGTSWQVTDSNVDNLYDSIANSYAPLIYRGAVMDMVCGRGMSREEMGDHIHGHRMINSIIKLAEFAPELYSAGFKTIAKSWLIADNYINPFRCASNINSVLRIKRLLEDKEIGTVEEPVLHKNFANMDRIVHKRPGFAFTLSMYSNRISNFEYMNGENKKAWHTADGMTYLYNDDLQHYSEGYWPTINPYRLPGTTVDNLERKDGEGWNILSRKSFVGGVSLFERYGAAGMDLEGYNSTLNAKKSWFMFDNEIICLGAGISSADNRTVETIVENRKIRNQGDNKLYINGVEMPQAAGWMGTTDNVESIYLEGNTENSGIGYYFPSGGNICALREKRTGCWKDINDGGSDNIITNNYVTLWFNHGTNPENETYAYTILPNRTVEQVEFYAQSPESVVLINNDKIQAVKQKNLSILGVNFWVDERQTIGKLTCNSKASVMLCESEQYIDIAVSDPTMENEENIEIEINSVAGIVEIKDAAVSVKQLVPTIKLSVDVRGARGRSLSARFKKL